MKNYLIVGYYGYENAGDELLLERTLELLTELEEPAFFHVLYNKRNIKKIEGKPNCKFINRWSFMAISQAIKKSDAIVFGGGGLFQDTTSAKSFLYYLGILTFALVLKKPVYFLAQGFSPIKRVGLRLIFGGLSLFGGYHGLFTFT
ncbi:MAG: Polysaccharide pyruvyl transferase [candidate division TM6 bacterium GW2011_GWF2_36_6]|nr:MAG: Polysaccharide pyruvyl transferase [candidate division TM6 bacterium GW2011_GWF2_36_6]